MSDLVREAPAVKAFPAVEAGTATRQEQDLITVVKGGGISFAGTTVVRVVNYVYSMVLVWGLGGDTFGLYTLATAIVTFVGVVAELGLGLSVVRFGAIDDEQGRSNVHRVTMSSLLISTPIALLACAVILATANPLATNVFHKPELGPLLRLLAWTIPLMSIESMLIAATKARKLVKYTAFVVMTQAVSALCLAAASMILKLGTTAIVLSFVISYGIADVLAVIFYLRVIPRESGPQSFTTGEIMKFALPLTFMKWIQYVNDRTEVFFLGLWSSTLYVGIYRIAWSLAGLETMLRLSLEEILAPFSSDLSHRQEIKQLGSLYKTTAKWSFTGALLLVVAYALFGTPILKVFDPSFAIGASVLVALGVAQLVNEATGACGTILIMSGRSDLSFLNTVVLFVSSVVLDWLLIPPYGLWGAALAGAATVILINIMRVLQVWSLLKIHPFSWSFLKPIVAGLVAGLAIWGAQQVLPATMAWQHLVYAMLFALIYIAAIVLQKLDADDMLVLHTVGSKVSGLIAGFRGAR